MEDKQVGRARRAWQALRRPSAKYSLLALLATGFVSGIVLWGGFNTAMEATNTLAFCISCHEMRDNVYQEYKQTVHYSNRTGVRAICTDCHVPREWTDKLTRKTVASLDLWGKLIGSIATREKFEAQRMKATDSQVCRNCHSFDAMSADGQKQTVFKKHMKARDAGQTCIDCHKGIAHALPREYKEEGED